MTDRPATDRPTAADERAGQVSRRTFLRVVSATTVGAVAFTGCKPIEHEMVAQSRALLAEEILSAYDDWYATACTGCAAGCGVIVRVVEGRAKKAEGTPGHPVNQGKLCARGQALVQEQYHPDRVQGPLLRNGQRGSGAFLPISWNDALDRLAAGLREQAGAGEIVLVTPPLGGVQGLLAQRLAAGLGASQLTLEPISMAPLREALRRVFGAERLPHFDIANTQSVLSFGADFLSTWISPVQHSVGYGVFRQGRYDLDGFAPRRASGRPRGHLVQIEPRFSVTAAAADTWLPVRPGAEGLLARAIASVLFAEGLAPGDPAIYGGASALEQARPEFVAGAVGVRAERITEVARTFAAQQPRLVLGGGSAGAHPAGADALTDIYAMNLLLGSVGQAGGVLLNPAPPLSLLPEPAAGNSVAEWQAFAQAAGSGQVGAVLLSGADPVYGLPASLGLAEALAAVPLVVSFSSFLDASTALADLILPSHLPLEDWGVTLPSTAPGRAAVTVQQPVVPPQFDTRSFGDTVLALAARLGVGGGVQAALPWANTREVVREAARELHRQQGGTGDGAPFEQFWVRLLQRGGWWPDTPPAPTSSLVAAPSAQFVQSRPTSETRHPESETSAYPFALAPFTHNTLADGRAAHLPWLQGVPDPLTSVAWQSWVEVNPRVAERLGLREGDLAAIETPAGRAELPVYVSPAAPPDLLSIPMGQGHRGYGRWAAGRGVNPLDLLTLEADAATGALAWAATRAQLVPLGRRARLPKLEGTVPAYQLTGAEVLKVTGRP